MAEIKCPQCGAPVDPSASECKFCGEKLTTQQAAQPTYVTGINPAWPVKSKIAAGVLALFVGGLGIHKFYLGKVGMGILYLLFCWTCIPSFIAFIEGIVYLCSSDENFQLKHHVRIG